MDQHDPREVINASATVVRGRAPAKPTRDVDDDDGKYAYSARPSGRSRRRRHRGHRRRHHHCN